MQEKRCHGEFGVHDIVHHPLKRQRVAKKKAAALVGVGVQVDVKQELRACVHLLNGLADGPNRRLGKMNKGSGRCESKVSAQVREVTERTT